jgi:hypothetical protein
MERGLGSDWVVPSCAAYQCESERFVFRYGLLILSQKEKSTHSNCGSERRMVSVVALALWLEGRDRPQHAGFRGVMSLIGPYPPICLLARMFWI